MYTASATYFARFQATMQACATFGSITTAVVSYQHHTIDGSNYGTRRQASAWDDTAIDECHIVSASILTQACRTSSWQLVPIRRSSNGTFARVRSPSDTINTWERSTRSHSSIRDVVSSLHRMTNQFACGNTEYPSSSNTYQSMYSWLMN